MNELLTAKPRVLVVDHEPMSRTLLDAVLRTDHRYEVLTASEGRHALDTARTVRPDLIMLSPQMPGEVDGMTVCQTLKAESRTRRIPILLIMSQTTTQERIQGFEAGADDFVTKPFNRIELLARVRSLLRIKALNDQLDEVEDVIYSLSRAIEAREGDADSDGGTERVTAYAQALGRALGLSDEALRQLGQAAMLRDVGKIGLPDNLLQKSGTLSELELQRMQKHTVLGEQIMAPLRSTASLLPIIRHHHERIDGKGYPDGLAGDQIPLGARIVAIADAYNAMLSHRPYRVAFTPEKAQQTLLAGAGRQWDAHLVSLFIDWASRIPRQIPTSK
ncbi:MAG: response regulator [Janthinobacterium lividum]